MMVCGLHIVFQFLKNAPKKFEHAAFFNVVLKNFVFRVVKNDRVWAKTTFFKPAHAQKRVMRQERLFW